MITIKDCINSLKEAGILFDTHDCSEVDIKSISFNSKEVEEGCLFICKGSTFNPKYLVDAIGNGAVAYVSEQRYENLPKEIPAIIVDDVRKAMTEIALLFYDYPSQKIDIAAVTATKGKTTFVHMLKSTIEAWEESCGLISTIEMFDGKEREESFNTTPESPDLQKWLAQMVSNHVKHCALEVSSQGLRYGRTDGTRFKVASFMNIARDHISPSEHKDFEDYFTAKLKIFEQTEVGIVNLDMDYSDRVLEYAKSNAKKVITYSLNDEGADFYCHDIRKNGGYTEFTIKSSYFDDGEKPTDEVFEISIPGWFNASNATAVIASCLILGEPVDLIKKGIKDAKVDGRMEIFSSDDGKIVAVVDYAHNKLSYESLFSAMEKDYPEHSKNTRIIFGSVGEKAFERREELGTIAGQRAKLSYISADYPGKEPFDKIASEIAFYVEKQGGDYKIIEDRNIAIEEAIMTADGPTLIMACGFGRLNWQKYADGYVPRESDVECVERCIKEYNRLHKS